MRFLLYIFLFFCGISSFAQVQSHLAFENYSHDFGVIKEVDGKQMYRFEFTNVGKTPIVINNVNTSCGCTSGEWTRGPILPSKKAYIKVVFDPRNRPGNFSKILSVYSNIKPKIIYLKIIGKVIPKTRTILDEYPFEMPSGLRLQYDKIAFMKVKRGAAKRLEVKFLNNSERSINLSLQELPKEIRLVSISKRVIPKKEGSFILDYKADKNMLLGIDQTNITVKLNGITEIIPLSADVREDYSSLSKAELHASPRISVQKRVFKLKDINLEGTVSRNIIISNKGESDLVINRIYSSAKFSFFMPSYELSPGDSTKLSINLKTSDFMGSKTVIVRIISNDPRKQEIKLRFIKD